MLRSSARHLKFCLLDDGKNCWTYLHM